VQGQFPISVDVYCWGASTCEGGRTTVATHGILTATWKNGYGHVKNVTEMHRTMMPWDIAVLRTADKLAGAAYTLGQVCNCTVVTATTDTRHGLDAGSCVVLRPNCRFLPLTWF
jgi:hypothetical protein